MKYLVAGTLALLVAAPAAAQSGPSVTSGGRVEARFGWDRAEFKDRIFAGDLAIERKDGKSGIAYGVEAGYDYVLDTSPILIGAYAGLAGSNIKDCERTPFGDRFCLKRGRNITVGARVGYVLSRGVVYLKGGYSNSRLKQKYTDADFPELNFNEGKNFGGFHLGAGGEVMITDSVYGKLEYVYTDYSNEKSFDDGVYENFGSKRHQIVAGVGLRF
ncbi:outer membrane protein [Sphingomonas sp. 3-13AW]|uniref:outer membrane protein n=1 Tax=Sphingomonas sp. 3-13AW TaxID=3050450 RepID=UPI003BB81382